MILSTINCSTGPVGVTDAVKSAFMNDPYSHRSEKFKQLLKKTTDLLSMHFKVDNTYLLTGSGTLANEVMLWQIKMLRTKGLILSNGEFGERLIAQAGRIGVEHETYHLEWGVAYDVHEIRERMQKEDLKWVLVCHCETSTGMINPLEQIIAMCSEKKFMVFADCTSTVGTRSIDLSKVAIATCSSGKGLGSFPGLAILLSNIIPSYSGAIPVYADLHQYHSKSGVPFTISSNMVEALLLSIRQKLVPGHFELIAEYARKIRDVLLKNGLLEFDHPCSSVFTFRLPTDELKNEFLHQGLIVSHESAYLQERNWAQLALFGKYDRQDLDKVISILSEVLIMKADAGMCVAGGHCIHFR